AALHSSSQLLRSGWNLLIYPEGTRSEDGRLREFQAGVGHLAKETRSPVIPMHVSGTHRVMPKGRRYFLPAPVRVRIGKPVTPAPGEGSRALTRRVEAAVRERLACGVVLIRHGSEVGPGRAEDLHPVGTIATLQRIETLPDGRFSVVARGLYRFRLYGLDHSRLYLQGHVERLEDPPAPL